MAIIEQVGAREILDSRGNPTVEVEVALEDGTLAPCSRAVGRLSTGEHEPSSCVTAATATAGRASRRPSARSLTEIAEEGRRVRADDQRLIDPLLDLDGTADKSPAGRQRAARRVVGRRQGGRRVRARCRCTAAVSGPTRTSCRCR